MKKILGLLVLLVCMTGLTAATPNIQVEKMMTEPGPTLNTGQYATVFFKVANTGETAADSVVIEFEGEYPFSPREDSDTRWAFREIEAGESYTAKAKIRVDRTAISGEEHLTFWSSHGNNDARRTHRLPVTVRDDDTALTIEDVDFPTRITPGATRTMTVTLSNRANTHFNNIDVTLDLNEQLPLAVADTTRQRVQQLDGGETKELSYEVFVDESAERGVYRLPISMEYENIAGSTFTQTEQTGIMIGGETSLDVGLERTELRRPGQQGQVTLRVVNRGEGQANFVSVALADTTEDGYDILSTNEIYIGNMIPDDFQTAEYDLYVEEGQDAVVLPMNVSYVNAQGDHVQEVQDVRLDLYSQSEIERYGLGNEQGYGIAAAAIIALLLVGGILYWRRRAR